jgi:hypothetical protein
VIAGGGDGVATVDDPIAVTVLARPNKSFASQPRQGISPAAVLARSACQISDMGSIRVAYDGVPALAVLDDEPLILTRLDQFLDVLVDLHHIPWFARCQEF